MYTYYYQQIPQAVRNIKHDTVHLTFKFQFAKRGVISERNIRSCWVFWVKNLSVYQIIGLAWSN